MLLLASAASADPPGLPAGVPNIYDPAVRGHFRVAGVANLASNPDFPALLLVNTAGEEPRALLLGLDARNGKDTWALSADPIILIVVFADAATIQSVYVDTGFAALGKASGTYAAVAKGNPAALADLLKKLPAAVTGPYI